MTKKRKSVASYGVTMPLAAKRLEYEDLRDPEKIMMRLWEEENTRNRSVSSGLVPLDIILHECGAACGKQPMRLTGETHAYSGKVSDRDRRVAAATVQWLAANSGRALLQKFFRELEQDQKELQKKFAEGIRKSLDL